MSEYILLGRAVALADYESMNKDSGLHQLYLCNIIVQQFNTLVSDPMATRKFQRKPRGDCAGGAIVAYRFI